LPGLYSTVNKFAQRIVFVYWSIISYYYDYYLMKLLRIPEIDFKESIPPAYVDWQDGTTTLFLLGA
jgi:hypothetical protein